MHTIQLSKILKSMEKELIYVEDVFSALHAHYQNDVANNQNDVANSQSLEMSLRYLNDVQQRFIEGNLIVVTTTLRHILRLGYRRKSSDLSDLYDNKQFDTAKAELTELKQAFYRAFGSEEPGDANEATTSQMATTFSTLPKNLSFGGQEIEEISIRGIDANRRRLERRPGQKHRKKIRPKTCIEPDTASKFMQEENLCQVNRDTSSPTVYIPSTSSITSQTTSEDHKHKTYLKDLDQDLDQSRMTVTHIDDNELEKTNKKKYSDANTRQTRKAPPSQEELEEKDRQIEELKSRVLLQSLMLSKMAGERLMEGNPNITDLSDANRPTKLAESFSELYDNEWCDAYEELTKLTNRKELSVIKKLLQVVDEAEQLCRQTINEQLTTICETFRLQMVEQNSSELKQMQQPSERDVEKYVHAAETYLKQAQRAAAPLSIPVLKLRFRKKMEDCFGVASYTENKWFLCYMDKCIEVIWLMFLQDPPMFLEGFQEGTKVPSNFREYTERGKTVVAVVWPCVHLYKCGPVMTKGVAVMK